MDCKYCSRTFNDTKKLSNHVPDCLRKHTENPPERRCPMCNEDYTRKSGSAYRTHLRKCEIIQNKTKTDSALKQAERRKKILITATCEHCSTNFTNITVGQFGDHRYKCKNNIPGYDKKYQTQYRKEIKKITIIVQKYYPEINTSDLNKMCQHVRRLMKDNPDEEKLVNEAYSKIT